MVYNTSMLNLEGETPRVDFPNNMLPEGTVFNSPGAITNNFSMITMRMTTAKDFEDWLKRESELVLQMYEQRKLNPTLPGFLEQAPKIPPERVQLSVVNGENDRLLLKLSGKYDSANGTHDASAIFSYTNGQ